MRDDVVALNAAHVGAPARDAPSARKSGATFEAMGRTVAPLRLRPSVTLAPSAAARDGGIRAARLEAGGRHGVRHQAAALLRCGRQRRLQNRWPGWPAKVRMHVGQTSCRVLCWAGVRRFAARRHSGEQSDHARATNVLPQTRQTFGMLDRRRARQARA